MTAEGIAILLGAASSLALAAVALARSPRQRRHWTFGLGMMAFGLEASASFVLVTIVESPEDWLRWLRIIEAVAFLLPVPWAFFVANFIPASTGPWGRHRRLGLRLVAAIGLIGATMALTTPIAQVADYPGPFYAARLERAGQYATIVQLLFCVGILTALEVMLRTSQGTIRWRIKYLVLGLGGIFLVRFYLLSHVLLFHVLMAAYLTVQAATLFVGNLLIGTSLLRNRMLESDLTVSRHILYRSVVVGVLGLYLFAAGAAGWMLDRLGLSETLFWGTLAIFLSALGVAIVLLSGSVRWRIKQFINRHFYKNKYDYREVWAQFTRRLGTLVTLDKLAPQLLDIVMETVGATAGLLYLASDRDGRYHLMGAIGGRRPAPTLDIPIAWKAQLVEQRAPVALELRADGRGGPEARAVPAGLAALLAADQVVVIVPLVWQGELIGLLGVGTERTGEPYSHEDLELLATVGEQASGAMVTAALSEKLAESREFDAFHRLISFVIHDLKNSTSALSLLSHNALEHFADPEFQRDAVKTLSKTVARMEALLARLSAGPERHQLVFGPVDLNHLVEDLVSSLSLGQRIKLTRDLQPIPTIRGDGEALQRVIQNLVTNAVEAIDGEGQITIRTYLDGAHVALAIADDGCGIAPEFLRKSLFAPFRSTKKGGWGIGLYQARWIVQSHGGTIEVASQEGQGTTFSVRLPVGANTGR